jgi:hypothetical protein
MKRENRMKRTGLFSIEKALRLLSGQGMENIFSFAGKSK